jgi:hypothetical protein
VPLGTYASRRQICVLLGTSASRWGRFKAQLVRMMSVSLSRVKCCSGPSARTLVLLLLMGQPSLAMAVPVVVRTSPSRVVTGLQQVPACQSFFTRVTFAIRSRSMGPPAVDAGRALTVYPPPNTCDGYAPPDLLPRTLAEVRLVVLPYLFICRAVRGATAEARQRPLDSGGVRSSANFALTPQINWHNTWNLRIHWGTAWRNVTFARPPGRAHIAAQIW